eukprot:CAMPEP_0194283108 /NCGR_PEP_ID=MMETSP0169-20130528/24690_1 /TAXON_ID=218684 /ORGANISM="Corethron pennatum, Strain L29A3" /LENGTH=1203 /DNA_ID=CAMNT_0039028643 /DNA_START=10 /DNA_END=3621 /DNA_ORIENTATION=+
MEASPQKKMRTDALMDSNFWSRLDTRLSRKAGNSQAVMEWFVEFMKLISGESIGTSIIAAADGRIPDWTPHESSDHTALEVDVGSGIIFYVSMHRQSSSSFSYKLFLTKDDANEFRLDNLAVFLEHLATFTGEQRSIHLPDIVEEICEHLHIKNCAFVFHEGSSDPPRLEMEVSFAFGKDGLAADMALHSISQHLKFRMVPVGEVSPDLSGITLGVSLSSYLEIALGKEGDYIISVFAPRDPTDTWKFDLHSKSGDGVRLKSLLDCFKHDSFTDSLNDNAEFKHLVGDQHQNIVVNDMQLGFYGTNVAFFYIDIGVSHIQHSVQHIKFSRPRAFFYVSNPFSGNREITASIAFDINFNDSSHPFHCNGTVSYNNTTKHLDGTLGASVKGTFNLKQLFHPSRDLISLNIKEIGDLHLADHLGKLSISNPSFLVRYSENPSVVLSWDGMMVDLDRQGKVALQLRVPLEDIPGHLLDAVRVEYDNKNPDPEKVIEKFTAELAVKDNLIEKGLKVMGITPDQDHLDFTIEIVNRQTRFLFPENILSSKADFGKDKFRVHVDNFYALPTSTDFEVGLSASADLWMWSANGKSEGKHIQVIGDLCIGEFGLTGSLTLNADFKIGAHFRITSLSLSFSEQEGLIEAEVDSRFIIEHGDSTASGELDIGMDIVGEIAVPTLFKVEYPGELSVKGIADVFLGLDLKWIPDFIGRVFVVKGVGSSPLKIDFNMKNSHFRIPENCCEIQLYNGFWDGEVHGYIGLHGFTFSCSMKDLNLGFLKITKSSNQRQFNGPHFEITATPENPFKCEISVRVEVMQIIIDVYLNINGHGMRFVVEADIWNWLHGTLTVTGDYIDHRNITFKMNADLTRKRYLARGGNTILVVHELTTKANERLGEVARIFEERHEEQRKYEADQVSFVELAEKNLERIRKEHLEVLDIHTRTDDAFNRAYRISSDHQRGLERFLEIARSLPEISNSLQFVFRHELVRPRNAVQRVEFDLINIENSLKKRLSEIEKVLAVNGTTIESEQESDVIGPEGGLGRLLTMPEERWYAKARQNNNRIQSYRQREDRLKSELRQKFDEAESVLMRARSSLARVRSSDDFRDAIAGHDHVVIQDVLKEQKKGSRGVFDWIHINNFGISGELHLAHDGQVGCSWNINYWWPVWGHRKWYNLTGNKGFHFDLTKDISSQIIHIILHDFLGLPHWLEKMII